jgi:hypothetical protein
MIDDDKNKLKILDLYESVYTERVLSLNATSSSREVVINKVKSFKSKEYIDINAAIK